MFCINFLRVSSDSHQVEPGLFSGELQSPTPAQQNGGLWRRPVESAPKPTRHGTGLASLFKDYRPARSTRTSHKWHLGRHSRGVQKERYWVNLTQNMAAP